MSTRVRTLLNLAWPIVLARATQAVIGLCDTLMVASLGEEALAGASTGAMNTIAVTILPMGTVFIVQSFVAQLRGRGELGSVRRFAWYGLLFALLAGIGAAVLRPYVPGILAHLDTSPGTHRAMSVYMSVRLLSVGAVIGTEALGNWYGGMGNTRLQMFSGIAAMVANVIGCYVLIMPRFGLPGWGVAGAGWASVIASWLGFMVVLVPFLMGHGYDRSLPAGRLRLREFGRMLRFGVPNGVNWLIEFSAFTVFLNVAIAHLGTTALAGMNVVMQINSIAAMPAFGLTSAGSILVAERLGQKAYDEVWPVVRLTGLLAGGLMMGMGILYLLVPRVFLVAFAPDGMADEAFMSVGVSILALAALWQVFDAIGMTLGDALRAAGDTTWCMVARMVVGWLLFVPLAWAAAFKMDGGVVQVVLAMVVYLAVLAAVLVWRFASGRWRNIDLVGKSEPQLL
ncbi:MAG TPA: MATE family efflux transporter [Kofleriaceae bacterium]